MAKIDLRKPQISLLKYEKAIAGSVGLVMASAAGAKAAGVDVQDHYDKIQQAHLLLAETITDAHDAIGATAAEAGMLLVEGGRPKLTVLEMVKSAFGLG